MELAAAVVRRRAVVQAQRLTAVVVVRLVLQPHQHRPRATIRLQRLNQLGFMRFSKEFWRVRHDALTAKRLAARMNTFSIYKLILTKTQASRIACDALAIRKLCAAITNLSVTIVVATKKHRRECVSRNCQWFWRCIWNDLSTWNSIIDTLKCRIE